MKTWQTNQFLFVHWEYVFFLRCWCMVVCDIISLHIRSMWETICDALASWSGWEFGSKIPVYPILGFGSQNTYPPPPPENWNLGRSWHFKTLRLFSFDLLRIPPSPPKKNLNLGRSWHVKTFQFWLVENTLPTPTPKLKFRQILAF